MLITGLTICLTLVMIGNDLAHNQSQGVEPGKVGSLEYQLANLEREFPLALEHNFSRNVVYRGAGEATVWELFELTASDFQRAMTRQGLATLIELEDVSRQGESRFQLNWTYTLVDRRSKLSLAVSANYTLAATDAWWDESWPYRHGVEALLPNPGRATPLSYKLNFTRELAGLGAVGEFDPSSLRVVGQDPLSGATKELAGGFLPASTYEAATRAEGEVLWASDPAFSRYYLYFDVMRNPSPARPSPAAGLLEANVSGWVVNGAYNWEWELVNNSYLRITQSQAVNSQSRGWLILGQAVNWSSFQLESLTEGAVRARVTSGNLTRQFTFWAQSPVVAWQDLAGGGSNRTGLITTTFSQTSNGSQAGFDYLILHRTGAYLALLVPQGASLDSSAWGSGVATTSDALSGYLIPGYQGSLAPQEVAEYAANLAGLNLKIVGTHRLA